MKIYNKNNFFLGLFFCLLACMLGHSVIGEVLSVPMTLAFGIMLAAMMLLELITVIYYNRKI